MLIDVYKYPFTEPSQIHLNLASPGFLGAKNSLAALVFLFMMMSNMHQMWMQLSSFMFILQLIKQFVPQTVYSYVALLQSRISKLTDPYIDISINEIVDTNFLSINRAYGLVEAYLNPKSSRPAKRIKCQLPQEGKKLIFSMDDYEEILDEF
ncbi:hypothetical protein C5167_027951 [Papaver somniferum]|nr:hypothetical protein C5167_027951 [Papaver somniferum]